MFRRHHRFAQLLGLFFVSLSECGAIYHLDTAVFGGVA